MSIGKNPNGLNQISASKIDLFVSGSSIVGFTSESVNIVGKVTASAVQTYEIGTPQSAPLIITSNVSIPSGSVTISGSVSASSFEGDGSQLFNIPADAIGDIDRLKSGSVEVLLSPNKGLEINTGATVRDFLIVTGSSQLKGNVRAEDGITITGSLGVSQDAIISGDLNVVGKITSTEIHTTYISSSVFISTGSNQLGDNVTDIQQITGSLRVSGSIFVAGQTIPTDDTTNQVLVINETTGRI